MITRLLTALAAGVCVTVLAAVAWLLAGVALVLLAPVWLVGCGALAVAGKGPINTK